MRGAIFFILLSALLSCKRETNNSQMSIENSITQGEWRISSYSDSGNDETDSFSGYTFTFETGGVFKARIGNISYQGFWSINDSNSADDTIEDLDFVINFPISPVNEINQDWNIKEQDSYRLELEHISEGSGERDILVFQKI